jgi:hypothetical protein
MEDHTADQAHWRVMQNLVWGVIVPMDAGAQPQDTSDLDLIIRS